MLLRHLLTVDRFIVPDKPLGAGLFVCLVADGLGSHAAGEVASRRTVESIFGHAPGRVARLLDAAPAAGGFDNVSIVLATFDPSAGAPPPRSTGLIRTTNLAHARCRPLHLNSAADVLDTVDIRVAGAGASPQTHCLGLHRQSALEARDDLDVIAVTELVDRCDLSQAVAAAHECLRIARGYRTKC